MENPVVTADKRLLRDGMVGYMGDSPRENRGGVASRPVGAQQSIRLRKIASTASVASRIRATSDGSRTRQSFKAYSSHSNQAKKTDLPKQIVTIHPPNPPLEPLPSPDFEVPDEPFETERRHHRSLGTSYTTMMNFNELFELNKRPSK